MCRTDSFKYSNTDENPGRKEYLNKNNSHQITTLIPNAVLEGAKEGANHIKHISSLFTLFLNLFPLTQFFKEEKAGEGECIILSGAGFYRAPGPAQHVRRRVCALDQLQLAKRFWLPSWLLPIDIPVLPSVSDYWSSTVTYRLHPPGLFHLETIEGNYASVSPRSNHFCSTAAHRENVQRRMNYQTGHFWKTSLTACVVLIFFFLNTCGRGNLSSSRLS